jgi:hypothetical protein
VRFPIHQVDVIPRQVKGALRSPLPTPRPVQVLRRPRYGDPRDDDRPRRDRANLVLPRVSQGMAADGQRDQGRRAATGPLESRRQTQPAASLELTVAGILLALRATGTGPARFSCRRIRRSRLKPSGVLTRLVGRRSDGRPSSRPSARAPARSRVPILPCSTVIDRFDPLRRIESGWSSPGGFAEHLDQLRRSP